MVSNTTECCLTSGPIVRRSEARAGARQLEKAAVDRGEVVKSLILCLLNLGLERIGIIPLKMLAHNSYRQRRRPQNSAALTVLDMSVVTARCEMTLTSFSVHQPGTSTTAAGQSWNRRSRWGVGLRVGFSRSNGTRERGKRRSTQRGWLGVLSVHMVRSQLFQERHGQSASELLLESLQLRQAPKHWQSTGKT